ncbi:putative bifunctional diguanylate cyclase/phosphodiesterase [Curvibacter gracilis]|uniref:putative bifunctional diguanylate cyclase/phosphodiesterase n=1 Tax=Curvibacter gracilis TaxID=230310 RepID=UPI00048168C2|nr:bifunctional diguanylate cyclase/phosphodiesterase [Curvibacter gracilis]
MSAPAFTNHLEALRLRVMDRMASLLESQTRSRAFASNLGSLVRQVQSEVMAELEALSAEAMPHNLALRLRHVIDTYRSLEQTMALLLGERQRQWSRNAEHAKSTLLEFNQTLTDLASTLIEKDLFERQSRVLERIILSHEHVAQWKAFVQEILADFHSIFPFNFFYIAFAEEHGLSLYLYYLGDYSEDMKRSARDMLSRQMLAGLNLPADTLLEIDEFEISVPEHDATVEDIRMITVAVPEHTPRLAGLLGVAYVGSNELTPQEESVVRSILSVMVMVVGSSKLLSRTLSELEYYAMHDPLTGLYNRRQFGNVLEYEFGRSERHGHEFSLLMLDLDDFKDINDSYGHQVGDEALRGMAEILRKQIRKGDVAARIGGDEFTVLLMETGRSGASTVAHLLGQALRERSFTAPDGKHFHLTVSIGIAVYPGDAGNEADILAGADQAMYRAKEMGKDGACTLESLKGKTQAGRQTRDYAERLRVALHQERIVPYFHSIVDCHSGELFACETLARMVEPNGDIVVAGQFIETIEKYGMGRELDRIIIRKALEAQRQRMAGGAPDIKVFLNLSAQEIQGRGVLAYAEDLCNTLGIPPQCIVFEILERDAIGDMTNMRTFLTQLRSRGFAFALDDFGSGYNSFHYLRELKFEYVKIDGAFVRNILNSKIDYALVHNLSRLCQDIGILTVAEFVESDEILQALREMGINYAQGYRISLPTRDMPLAATSDLGRKA